MFIIRAKVKYSKSSYRKMLYAGRNVNLGCGNLNPCWCDKGDEDICHFTTLEEAVDWFEESKHYLTQYTDEITDVVVSELVLVDKVPLIV